MTRSLKLYNGSDSSPIIDLTDDSANPGGLSVDWDRCEFASVADHGQSTAGSIVIRDPGGLVPDYVSPGHFLSSHNVIVLTDGPTTVWRGRIEAQDSGRGVDIPQEHDRYREWTLTVSDYNADLAGIAVHSWARPAETDVARVQSLVAAYLSGSPRATTNLNGSNYVSGSNTVALPAETFTGKYVSDVLSEIATTANKQYYVDPDGYLHYDGNDSVAFASGLRVSDIPADWNTVTYPPETPTVAEEGREEITALRYYYGNNATQQSVYLTNPALAAKTDYWEGIFWDSDSITSAQATTRANALFAVQDVDVINYKFALGPISGGQTGLIRAGQMINVKSRALIGGRTSGGTYYADSFQLKRIGELRWRPVKGDPLTYMADVSLERPLFLGGRPSGSQSITTQPTPPVPPSPASGPTLLETWTWDGGQESYTLHAANAASGVQQYAGGTYNAPTCGAADTPGAGTEGTTCYNYVQIGGSGTPIVKASPGDVFQITGWFWPYADTCRVQLQWVSNTGGTIISSEWITAHFGPGFWTNWDGTSSPAPAGTVGFTFGCAKETDGTYKTHWRDQIRIYKANGATSSAGTTPPTYSGSGSYGSSQVYIPADTIFPLPPATGRVLTNQSGGAIVAGDVVFQDPSNASSFTTTITLDSTAGWVGVATESIAAGASGMVQLSGFASVKVPSTSGAIALHDYLYTFTTAKTAHGSNIRTTGAFGQALTAGSNSVTAILWGQTDPTVTGGTTSPLTTKGDVYGYSSTNARIPIGSDAQVLTADSTQTLGLKWASLPAGAGTRVYNSGAFSVAASAETAVTFDSERSDSDAFHSTSSNTSRLTVPTGKAGRYAIAGTVEWAASALGTLRRLSIRLNGTTYLAKDEITSIINAALPQSVETVYDLVATDYVELVAFQDTVGAVNLQASGNYSPEFGMMLAGAAASAPTMVRGRVTAAGGVGTGTGFSVSRTATGKFDVTYTSAFAAEPIVDLTVWDDGSTTNMTITLHASSTTGFTAWVFSGAGTAFANFAFNFIAIAQ